MAYFHSIVHVDYCNIMLYPRDYIMIVYLTIALLSHVLFIVYGLLECLLNHMYLIK